VRLALARTAGATGRTAPPLVFGVDAVAVERVGKLLPAYGHRLARRLATAAEAAWVVGVGGGETSTDGSADRLAALLAVKESAVKCLAGRPPGFRWQCVELALEADPPVTSGAVAATFEAFAAGVELAGGTDVACRLTGVALDRGVDLLRAAPWSAVGVGRGETGTIRGMARYGTLDGTVLAVAAFWEEPG
jgi:phosphopantetheinyl transferase (holo-ACP synthase)